MVVLDEPLKKIVKIKNYIDGDWVESESDEKRDIINPAKLEKIAEVPEGCAEDVKMAVDAAVDAFPSWRKPPP